MGLGFLWHCLWRVLRHCLLRCLRDCLPRFLRHCLWRFLRHFFFWGQNLCSLQGWGKPEGDEQLRQMTP